MAENEILFRIKVVDEGGKLAALDAEIMQLTKARDELSKKMKAGNKLTAEEAKEYERLTRELVAVKNERRDMQKALENETKASQLNEKSLAAMRIQLSNLRKEFDKLDPASDKSKGLSLEINKLQQEINGADFSTGNFRANVGNYSNAIMDAFQKTGIFSGGLGNLGGVINGLMSKLGGAGGAGGLIGSVGALGAGLIALPLAAVAGGFAMLKGYFESTAERAIPLKAAVAGLKGAFDDLKTAVNANIGSFANFVTKSMTGIVGLFGGLGAQARFQLREALTTQQLEAQRALKFMEVEYAKEQVVIEELRVKAQQKDRYNLQEREAFLSEALEKEKNFTNKRVEYLTIIANTEEELQKMSDSNEEDENRLLEMKKQRYNAESELNRKSRKLVTKLSEFRMQTTNENKAASEKAQAARFEQFKTESEYYKLQQEENERIRKEIDEIINLSDLYEDKWIKLQKKFDEQTERMKRIDEMRKGLGEEEIIEPETDALLKQVQTFDQLTKKINSHRLGYQSLRKEIEKTALTEEQKAKMSIVLAEEETNAKIIATKQLVDIGTSLFKEDTLAYKIFATAKALMATRESMAKALEYPYPFNFILRGMIFTAGMADIAAINKVKFQKGGVLEGASHSQGGIPIRVAGRQIVEAEGGEIIVNKNIWTRPDYVEKISEMNYRTGGKRFAAGGVLPSEELDFERIVDTIVNKIAAIPVVVSERDISSTQRKVLVTNNLGKI